MIKFFSSLLFIGTFFLANAQYSTLDAILTKLEERKGINKNLSNLNIDDKKFILIKDFNDHTERNFIVIKENKATYVEIFDDKSNSKSTSNVFTGDIVRSNKNIISLRADKLENNKIPVPITKTFLLTKLDDIIYLIDVNSKDRWIDEASFSKLKNSSKK